METFDNFIRPKLYIKSYLSLKLRSFEVIGNE